MVTTAITKASTFLTQVKGHENTAFWWRYLAVLMACFFVYKSLSLGAVNEPTTRYIGYALSAVFIVLAFPIKFAHLPKSVRLLMGVVGSLFMAYLAFSSIAIADTDLTTPLYMELYVLKYVAILCGVLSFWRVGFALFLFSYVHWQKGALAEFFQMNVSKTDYMPLVEAGVLMVLAAMVYHYWKYAKVQRQVQSNQGNQLEVLEVAFLISVAAHFANYFYSGVTKLYIANFDPFYWVMNNETQHLISNSLAVGGLPLSFSNSLVDFVYSSFSSVVVGSNFLILIGQLLAIFAITKIRPAQWLTFFYDITHIVIFVVTGIFFYKWIIYNFTIIAALGYLKHKVIPSELKLGLMATVLLAPAIFFVAKLGWYDTPSFNNEHFEAVTKNGETLRIPSNYFLNVSVTHAQQRIYGHKGEAFPPTGSLGMTMKFNRYQQSKTCYEPVVESENFTIIEPERTTIQNRLMKVHNYYLQREESLGKPLNFDMFPHHVFSMPWGFEAFKNTMKKDIVAYKYVLDANCYSIKDGKLVYKPISKGEYIFHVQ